MQRLNSTLMELNRGSLAKVVALPHFGCFATCEDGALKIAAMTVDGGIDQFRGEINWTHLEAEAEADESFVGSVRAAIEGAKPWRT